MDGRVEVPAVAVHDVVRVPGVRRLHDEHRRGAEPARTGGRTARSRLRPRSGARRSRRSPSSSRGDLHEPAALPRRRRASAALSSVCRTCACPSRAQPGPACLRPRPGRSGAWRGSVSPPRLSTRLGRARSCGPEAGEQRRGAGMTGAEHDAEDDCRCSATATLDARLAAGRRRCGAMFMPPPSEAAPTAL
jgi:hypothetical protein